MILVAPFAFFQATRGAFRAAIRKIDTQEHVYNLHVIVAKILKNHQLSVLTPDILLQLNWSKDYWGDDDLIGVRQMVLQSLMNPLDTDPHESWFGIQSFASSPPALGDGGANAITAAQMGILFWNALKDDKPFPHGPSSFSHQDVGNSSTSLLGPMSVNFDAADPDLVFGGSTITSLSAPSVTVPPSDTQNTTSDTISFQQEFQTTVYDFNVPMQDTPTGIVTLDDDGDDTTINANTFLDLHGTYPLAPMTSIPITHSSSPFTPGSAQSQTSPQPQHANGPSDLDPDYMSPDLNADFIMSPQDEPRFTDPMTSTTITPQLNIQRTSLSPGLRTISTSDTRSDVSIPVPRLQGPTSYVEGSLDTKIPIGGGAAGSIMDGQQWAMATTPSLEWDVRCIPPLPDRNGTRRPGHYKLKVRMMINPTPSERQWRIPAEYPPLEIPPGAPAVKEGDAIVNEDDFEHERNEDGRLVAMKFTTPTYAKCVREALREACPEDYPPFPTSSSCHCKRMGFHMAGDHLSFYRQRTRFICIPSSGVNELSPRVLTCFGIL